MPSPFSKLLVWAPKLAPAPVADIDIGLRTYEGVPYWWNGVRWVALPKDPYFANVGLLIRGDRFHDKNHLRDSSSRANHPAIFSGVANGTAGQSAAITRFTGMRSWYSANNSAPVGWVAPQDNTGLSMGTGDFTLEAWFYQTASGGYQQLIDLRNANSGQANPTLILDVTTNMVRFLNDGATFRTAGTNAMTQNVWHHVHVTRISSVTYVGMDGVQEGADFADTTNYNANALCWIGLCPATSNAQAFVGYWQELRITKGVARYARTYTVPTAPFPDY